MTKEQIINNICYMFDYSSDDFDGMTIKEIIEYLSEENIEYSEENIKDIKALIKEYSGVRL